MQMWSLRGQGRETPNHKIIKKVWRLGSARTLWVSAQAPTGPSTVDAMEGNTLAAVKGRFAARKRGGMESTLEEAIYHRERFRLQAKCMCGSRAPPDLVR